MFLHIDVFSTRFFGDRTQPASSTTAGSQQKRYASASPVTPFQGWEKYHQKPSKLGVTRRFNFNRLNKKNVQDIMELKSSKKTKGGSNIHRDWPFDKNKWSIFLSETNGIFRDQNWNTTPYPKRGIVTFHKNKMKTKIEKLYWYSKSTSG